MKLRIVAGDGPRDGGAYWQLPSRGPFRSRVRALERALDEAAWAELQVALGPEWLTVLLIGTPHQHVATAR